MSTPRERPILFSAPMVRALLAGRKTVTRRIVKLPYPAGEGLEWHRYVDAFARCENDPIRWEMGEYHEGRGASLGFLQCPYGVEGDRLWVRESCWLKSHEVLVGNELVDGNDREILSREWTGLRGSAPDEGEPPHVWYAADGSLPTIPEYLRAGYDMRWDRRNSIHMPRWASRLLLEVTDIRVERLHDITEEDAAREGVTPFPKDLEGDCWTDGRHRTAFQFLWNEINGWSPDAWAANPWVWAVSFQRVDNAVKEAAA